MGKCVVCGKQTREDWHEYCDEHFKASRSSPGRTPSGKPGLPANYLTEGYFDKNGNLRPELIGEQAKHIALSLDQAGMKAASLRRFFGKVKFAQRKLESTNDFQTVLPEILELEPYVNNALTRGVVPSLFRLFIEKNLAQARTSEKAFNKGFAKHFEYVVAFFPKK